MLLLFISSAPVFLILLFVYIKDKYEKEPLNLLLKVLVAGAIIPIFAIIIEKILMGIGNTLFTTTGTLAFFDAFIVAGMTEETLKFLVIYLIIWKNREFNEKFDGIVYATFASLGFALVENILYVASQGLAVGAVRALTAVPAHATFGITMGFFFGLAKFDLKNQKLLLATSLILPVILHGFYDFCIMSQNTLLMLLFIPYLIAIIYFALKMIQTHSKNSRFNPQNRL